MFIKKNNSPLVINFYLDENYISKGLTPKISKNCIPKWWKELPSTYEDHEFKQIKWATVKKCVGAIETFMNGIIIPFAEDFSLFDEYNSQHVNHWDFDCTENIEFLIIQSTWTLGDYNRDFTVVPKFIKTKKKSNLNVEIYKHPFDVGNDPVVPQGTDFLQMIPITEKDFELNIKSIN